MASDLFLSENIVKLPRVDFTTEGNKQVVQSSPSLLNIFEDLHIYTDPHSITLTAPLLNVVELPKEDAEIEPWSQTVLPTKESLNLDVALLKERLAKEKLLQPSFSSKIRKNKSKVMLFQVRANDRKHLPYWNVQRYIELGATSCSHSECFDYFYKVLYYAQLINKRTGKLPSLQLLARNISIWPKDNGFKQFFNSSCYTKFSICQFPFLSIHNDLIYFENSDDLKLGNMKFDLLHNIPIKFTSCHTLSYSFPWYPLEYKLSFGHVSTSFPPHLREFGSLLYQYICISVMYGSFEKGLEMLRLQHASLTPAPCRWVFRSQVEGVASDVGLFTSIFPNRTFSRHVWALFFYVVHDCVVPHYFPSLISLYERCKVSMSNVQFCNTLAEAHKIALMKDVKIPLQIRKCVAQSDSYSYDYKKFVKSPFIKPFYKFHRSVLNIMSQWLSKRNLFIMEPQIHFSDLLFGASNMWECYSPDVCVHGNAKPLSGCIKSVGYSNFFHLCVNHGAYFISDTRCELAHCETCTDQLDLSSMVPTSLTNYPAEKDPFDSDAEYEDCETSELQIEDKKFKRAPYFWERWWSGVLKPEVDESYSYPEEKYVSKSDTRWMEECFKGFLNSFKDFISKEFSGLYDQISQILSNIWSVIMAPFQSIANMLSTVTSPFVTALHSMLDLLGLSSVTRSRNLTVDLYCIFIAVLVYHYVSNPLVKILTAIFLCRRFRLIENVSSFLKFFRESLFDMKIPEVSGFGSTSYGSFLTMLSGIPPLEATVKIIIGIIMTTAGLAATAAHKASLCKIIVDIAKNLHFIGAGFSGVVKIWEHISKGIPKLFAYIRSSLKIQNKSDIELEKKIVNRDKFSKRLVNFFVICEHYDSESGYRLIRKSVKVQNIIKNFNQFYLMARVLLNNEFYAEIFTPQVRVQFSNACKQYVRLLNVVHRLDTFGRFRDTPFHIQFVGDPGIGKSTILSKVTEDIRSVYFPDVPINHLIYTRGNTDHFDGYSGQPIMLQDDIWSANDFKSVAEILPLISNAPLVLPMAHLDAKSTFFESKFIITTTNTPFPQTSAIWCNEAIWRRRHLLIKTTIDPRVKDNKSGKFNLELFDKYYPDQNAKDFPHLSFTLLSPTDANNAQNGLGGSYNGMKYDRLFSTLREKYELMRTEERKVISTSGDAEINYEFSSQLKSLLNNDPDSLLGPITSILADLPIICDDSEKEEEEKIDDWSWTDDLNKNLYYDFLVDDIVNQDVDFHADVSCLPSEEPVDGDIITPSITEDLKQTMLANDTKDASLIDKIINADYRLCSDLDAEKILRECPTNTHQALLVRQKIAYAKEKRKESDMKNAKRANSKKHNLTSSSSYYELMHSESSFHTSTVQNHHQDIFIDTFTDSQGGFIKKFKGQANMEWQYKNNNVVLHQKLSQYYPRTTHQDYFGNNHVLDDVVFHPLKVNLTELRNSKEYKTVKENNSNFESNFNQLSSSISDFNVSFLSQLSQRDFKDYFWKVAPFDLRSEDFEEHLTGNMMSKYLAQKQRFEKLGIEITPNSRALILREIVIEKRCIPQWSYLCENYSELQDIVDSFHKTQTVVKPSDHYPEVVNNPLVYSKKFYTQMNLFLSLPPHIQYFLSQFYSGKNISFLSSFSCKLSNLYKYYAVKYSKLIHGAVYSKMVGIYDIIVTLLTMLYSVATYHVIRSLLKSIFNVKEEEPEPTSRVLFKRDLPNHLSKMVKNSNPLVLNSVLGKLRKNIVQLKTYQGTANGIGIDGQNILCNLHFLQFELEAGLPFQLSFLPTTLNEEEWSCYINPKTDIVVIPNSDACIIHSSSFRFFSNISHLFVTQKDIDTYSLPDEIHNLFLLDNREHVSTQKSMSMLTNASVPFLDNKINKCVAFTGSKILGSSGSPVFAINNYTQRPLFGIKCCANNNFCLAVVITQEDLIKHIPKSIIHEGPINLLSNELTQTSLLITEHVLPVGSIKSSDVVGIVKSTSFQKTVFSDEFPSESIPAILNAFDSRVPPNDHPLRHSVNKFGRDVIKPMHPDILNKAVNDVSQFLLRKLKGKKLRVLSFEESILGLKEPGYGRMDLTTSPGLPWCLSKIKPGKKTWLNIDEQGDIDFVDSQFKSNYYQFQNLLEQGVIPANSMFEFPKDELRPIAKVLGPPIKTRSISVMDFTLTILFRRYCLSLEAFLHTMADGTFPFCVGINPTSFAWANLYKKLQSINDVGNDFDIGNWDGHFPPWLFDAVVDCFNKIYDDDPKYKLARKCLFSNACHGFTNFLDLVLQKQRGMPSGFPGTAIVNTFGHYILFYCFYILICQTNLKPAIFDEFNMFISAFFYGDDAVFSIHNDLKLQGITSRAFIDLYQEYGWPISSASKNSDPSIEKPILELQFLKRHFKLDPLFGSTVVYGAIEKEVINNLLHWQRKTPNDQLQLYVNINEALEFSYAHGSDFYNDILQRVNEILSFHQKDIVICSYSDMRSIILSRYFLD